MEKYSYVHMTAFTFEPMIALMHMIGEGVFDRYPRLKVAYVEELVAGCPLDPAAGRALREAAAAVASLPAQTLGDYRQRPGGSHL